MHWRLQKMFSLFNSHLRLMLEWKLELMQIQKFLSVGVGGPGPADKVMSKNLTHKYLSIAGRRVCVFRQKVE